MEQKQEVVIARIAMLLKKYGIRTLTIDEISKRVGISKAKLHAFLGNKEQILSESLDFINNELKTKLGQILLKPDDAVEKLHQVYQITFDHLSEFHSMFFYDLRKNDLLKNKIQEYNAAFKTTIVYPLLEEAKTEKYLIPGSDINEAADCYMKFIYYFLINYKSDPVCANKLIASFFNKYIDKGLSH